MARIMVVTNLIDARDTAGIAPEPLAWPYSDEGSPFASPTIQQLMEFQRVEPLLDVSTLAGVIGDDEIDDFVASIYAARERV